MIPIPLGHNLLSTGVVIPSLDVLRPCPATHLILANILAPKVPPSLLKCVISFEERGVADLGVLPPLAESSSRMNDLWVRDTALKVDGSSASDRDIVGGGNARGAGLGNASAFRVT